jgi:beta-glucanase (GH16 family)
MKSKLYSLLILALLSSCGKGKGNSGPDNPIKPSISIGDVSSMEGNGGTTIFTIPVTLSQATSATVSMKYNTGDGSAKSGQDYTAVSDQTLTFAPNETTKNISITVTADDIKEGDETFKVSLSNPVNGTLFDEIATVTIGNDDTKVPFTDAGYVAPTSYAGYTLAWADEFTSGTLDNTAWTVQTGDGCPGLCGWGNNELEYYTSRPQNLFFQDGKLIMEATKEVFNGKNYTSTKLITSGKKYFKYGRVDIRAKLPIGQGIWPGLWMLPQNNVYGNWPTSGEIDIMEMIGHQANRAYGTLHYGPGPGSNQIGQNYTLPSGVFNDEFHVFSMEWKQDQIKLYVDDHLFSTVNKTDVLPGTTYPFNEDFFFIFNLAVGGNWPGSPDATTYFPQWLIVDYIRMYQ